MNNLLKPSKLFGKFFKSSPKLTKAAIDEHHAYLATRIYENALVTNSFTQADDEKFYSESMSLSEGDRRKYIANSLNERIVNMFSTINECVGRGGEKPLSKDSPVVTSGILKEKIGFELEIKQSNNSGANRGLFVKTDKVIRPGTIMGFYPGLVYVNEFVKNQREIEKLLPDDDLMLMVRTDNKIIDGRTAEKVNYNPYGVCQYLNHINNGQFPNVIPILFDFPRGDMFAKPFPQELRYLIPNEFAKKPTLLGTIDRSAIMHTIVFLANDNIKDGDELLMNYRLNPKLKLPSWYYHFDPHALYHAQTTEEEAAQRMMLFSNNAAVEADKDNVEEYVNEEMLQKFKNQK